MPAKESTGPELCRSTEPDGRATIKLVADGSDAELVWVTLHRALTADTKRPVAGPRADALIAVSERYLANGPADRSGNNRTAETVHTNARRAFLTDGTRLHPKTSARVACPPATRYIGA